jgi:hypothetical protein
MDNGVVLGAEEERRTWSDVALCMLGFGQSDDAIVIDNEFGCRRLSHSRQHSCPIGTGFILTPQAKPQIDCIPSYYIFGAQPNIYGREGTLH